MFVFGIGADSFWSVGVDLGVISELTWVVFAADHVCTAIDGLIPVALRY